MADQPKEEASFWTQSNALFRKNLTYQKRNWVSNCVTIVLPFIVCQVLSMDQDIYSSLLDNANQECGVRDLDNIQSIIKDYDNGNRQSNCPVSKPPKWPPMIQIPARSIDDSGARLFKARNKTNEGAPLTILITAENRTFGENLSGFLFPSSFSMNSSGTSMDNFAYNVLGSDSIPLKTLFYDKAFSPEYIVFSVQSHCLQNTPLHIPPQLSPLNEEKEVQCVEAMNLWRDNASLINDEIYKAYPFGKHMGRNDILAGYNFLNTTEEHFNVGIWFNSTKKGKNNVLLRVSRSVNLVSNAYLELLKGPTTKVLLEFISEMPKPRSNFGLNIVAINDAISFVWLYQLLLPIILASLVYEKDLRVMMRLHGLGDASYMAISYAYFLSISTVYLVFLFLVASLIIQIGSLRINNFLIQFLFAFIYANLQISMAFLGSAMFKDTRTARVLAYAYVIMSGLVGEFIFMSFVTDLSFSRNWIFILELFPGLSLYRGLYEFSEYSDMANQRGYGLTWSDLNDDKNGMKTAIVIMLIEWLIFLVAAYYIESEENNPLVLLQSYLWDKKLLNRTKFLSESKSISVSVEILDVTQERERVESFLSSPNPAHWIVCDKLKKIYPKEHQNRPKLAVNELSLMVPQGECFGMVGPKDAGKTSILHMMVGFTRPSSGATFVQGMDVRTHMHKIRANMGVCPQRDLLWETLTLREHLLFYGRLKNLTGPALSKAVEGLLNCVNLNYDYVPDTQARQCSKGMKRRLSVAISLLGDPKVVFMDEPTTGIDPYSKNILWNVVKKAKQQGRAIIITTQTMKEAEALCDRVGIFVDGRLQCIGNTKELKARHGGSIVLTMRTPPEHFEDVEKLVMSLSQNAIKTYHIGETQKFKLEKSGIRIGDVFKAVEDAKRRFTVAAWTLADTTLEDVYINVAHKAHAFDS